MKYLPWILFSIAALSAIILAWHNHKLKNNTFSLTVDPLTAQRLSSPSVSNQKQPGFKKDGVEYECERAEVDKQGNTVLINCRPKAERNVG